MRCRMCSSHHMNLECLVTISASAAQDLSLKKIYDMFHQLGPSCGNTATYSTIDKNGPSEYAQVVIPRLSERTRFAAPGCSATKAIFRMHEYVQTAS
jgi:hypothetical protein